ncbi:MAG TPA: hypothetical protein VKB86_19170 [Pyrinomonadaceae bacterium]|nr:hypothetical protein [Pyrinomonadaceae bacterium]
MAEDDAGPNLLLILVLVFLVFGGYVLWKIHQASSTHICTFQCGVPVTALNQVTVMQKETHKLGEAKSLDGQGRVMAEVNDGECGEYVATFQDKDCVLVDSK